MNPIDVRDDLSEDAFVNEYVANRKPVVISNMIFQADQWYPTALKESIGDLTTQVYGTLFELENVVSLEEYLEDYFGNEDGPMPTDVPYVRWYNQLKDVDFVWSDEAFAQLSSIWQKPTCVPANGLLVPVTGHGGTADPVTDNFPYRGILVAARGARTRMHRDPFCSDAIVAQFYGTKEAALYHPDRTEELTERAADDSFGGFIDVRQADPAHISVEPDYFGQVEPGQMIYIPHGWLHDVICLSDSISVTWNFVHERGASEFMDYLRNGPGNDSEFEVLQYFFERGGFGKLSSKQMLDIVAAQAELSGKCRTIATASGFTANSENEHNSVCIVE